MPACRTATDVHGYRLDRVQGRRDARCAGPLLFDFMNGFLGAASSIATVFYGSSVLLF